MNFACLICWESYSESCIIATAPCGHVFHFNCIQKWLRTGNQDCAQCRQNCEAGLITKLYFSEDKSAIDENQARIGLEEENLKWKMEANAANETSILFQKENIKLKKKLYDIKTQSNKTEENLNKRIKELEVNDVKTQANKTEENLNKRIKELEEMVNGIMTKSNKTEENLKKRIKELEEKVNDQNPQYQLFPEFHRNLKF